MNKFLVTQRRRVTYSEYRTVLVTCANATYVIKEVDAASEPWQLASTDIEKLPDHVFAIDTAPKEVRPPRVIANGGTKMDVED